MMKNRFWALFLVLLSSVAFALSDGQRITSEQLVVQLPAIESIECKFKQEKQIKNLQKPLISGGNFKFVKDEGVYFETLYPIKSTVSYTNKEYKQINDIILAISNRKYSKIDKEFSFLFSKEKDSWSLQFEPKSGSRAEKYLESLLVEGEKDIIEKIVITAKDGSKTTQWFFVE